MGFFSLFKKNKNNNTYDKLPPVFQKAFAVLFPNGVDDHERQLKELSVYFDFKYNQQEIDSNLIFILSGYLVTGDTKTREFAVSNVLKRPNNRMLLSEVEYLYNYAVKNHPKLKGLLLAEEIMDRLSNDGCYTDVIPGGSGLFGFSSDNPIPVKGVIGIYDYLSRLYDGQGILVSYERSGTVESYLSKHPVDEYHICSTNGSDTLYFSTYHKRTSQLSPSNYVLVDDNKVIISNGGTKYSLGQKFDERTLDLPKLMGLSSFACFSDKELVGQSDCVTDRERINREAIVLSNNGNLKGAIERLDTAISMGSLNAVNNKFTVLHTAGQYKEGYDFLMSILDTEMATIRVLYNLAVLYYNGKNDTNYNINKDIRLSYNLLLTAINTPINKMEEHVEGILKKVKELMSQLENEDPSLIDLKNQRQSSTQKPTVSDNIVKLNETHEKSPTEIKIQNSTPTKDIYGDPLMNRLDDIYDCIHSAAEDMIREMVGMPKLSEKGVLELELLFAAILSHDIDKNIVLQSLLTGNDEFRKLDITNVLLAIDSYHNQYQYDILNIHVSQRVPLMEFAKAHGKLKISTLPKQDTFGNYKVPIFVKNDSEILECHFAFWGENTHTPDFIVKNKNNIVVDLSTEGEYIFRHIDDINQRIDDFMKYITFYAYKSPLDYHTFLSGDEIEEAIKNIKRDKTNIVVVPSARIVHPSEFEETSNITTTVHYAFTGGTRALGVLSASIGLVGKFK